MSDQDLVVETGRTKMWSVINEYVKYEQLIALPEMKIILLQNIRSVAWADKN